MSSKKSLLSKLKKDLGKKKIKTTIETTDTVSVNDRRIAFLQEIKTALLENKPLQDIHDRIKIYISFYPDDNEFSRLLDFTLQHLETFLHQYDKDTNVMSQIQLFYKQIFTKTQQNQVEILKNRLTLPTNKTILYSIDPFVFESIQFIPDYNNILLPDLIHYLLHTDHSSTLADLRKSVHQFLFQHRFDYIIRYLEDDTHSNKEKQSLVVDIIQSECENIRSIHMYLQILNLIDENITSFQTPLQSILFRFVPNKENITILRNYFEVILDVIINNASEKQMVKYFSNKKKFDYFKTHILPHLYSREQYTRIIQHRCRQEIDQSYMFYHAVDIHWDVYLSIIKKHVASSSISSIEVDLYHFLHKNSLSDILTQLILLVQQDGNKSQIQILLSKYISLHPFSERKKLEKLKNISSNQKLKSLLIEIRDKGDFEDFRVISSTTSFFYKSPYDFSIQKDNIDVLYRSRFDIHNFDHFVIEPIDDISIYIHKKEPSSNKLFIPNDLFYQELMDPNIQKSQKDTTFILNKKKMRVLYATLTNDYILQNEHLYQQGLLFIEQQKSLETATNPLSFFTYFISCPILNHKSSFMSLLRQKTSARLSSILTKELVNYTENIEPYIYMYSQTLNDYTTSISILITLLTSPHANIIKQLFLQKRLKLSMLGELLRQSYNTIFDILFPEIYVINDETMMKKYFTNKVQDIKRRIILDAYFIQNPMRRIPYIPIRKEIGIDLEKIMIQKDVSIPENTIYLQEPIIEDIQQPLPITINGLEEEIIHEELDPLADFIDTAFEELEKL